LRQPWNVFVFLFRRINEDYEFALFKRKDDGIWQGVAGGGEDGENPKMAAYREVFEEAGLTDTVELHKLDSISYIEAINFIDYKQWGEDTYVVPMYFYAAEFGKEINISDEHSEYGWFSYEEARELLYWHDNKVALWELNERLKRRG